MSKKVSYSIIFKRQCCLNSNAIISESVDNTDRKFSNLNNQIENIKKGGRYSPSIKNSIISFMENLCNVKNASKYSTHPIYLIQEFNIIDPKLSNEILNKYTAQILPYVENLSYIRESITRYNIEDEQKETILESASNYIVADRIIRNHNTVSKRFNIEDKINMVKSRGLRNITEFCCKMIDTYTIAPYQKMNLCIEEMSYLMDKNAIRYDRSELTKYITEYFLLRCPELSDKDLNNYKRTLTENYCLNKEDLNSVSYLFDNDSKTNNRISVKKEISNFLLQNYKTIESMENVIINSLPTTIIDLKANIDKLLWLIWNCFKYNLFDLDSKEMGSIIEKWFDLIINKLSDNAISNCSINREDVIFIRDNICKFKNDISNYPSDDFEYHSKLSIFKDKLDIFINKLFDLSNTIYPQYNLECINYLRSNNDKMLLSEFKVFKCHNLVTAAMNLDKHLQKKGEKLIKNKCIKVANSINGMKNIMFPESVDIYSMINEHNKFDVCVAQYYYNENNIDQVHNLFIEICKEFNEQLQIKRNNYAKAYYIINPSILEVHLGDSCNIDLNDDESKMVQESEDNSLDAYIEIFSNILRSTIVAESLIDKPIMKRLLEIDTNNFSLEYFKLVLETLSMIGFGKEEIKVFGEKFCDSRYKSLLESEISNYSYKHLTESNIISSLIEKWEPVEEVPFIIQMEACSILNSILEIGPDVKKPEVTKPKVGVIDDEEEYEDEEDDNEENDQDNDKEKDIKSKIDNVKMDTEKMYKGLNLNKLKLSMLGLQSKVKDAGQKEKELSRNLDNSVKLLVKGMKDALVSDRREAIIKGSVIPSFSKCLKIGIGLAAMGVFNPVAPIVAAIGGFAMSKSLTKKERILLLDEIETELEVLEKEIAMADSKNQMKKLRQLLKYKKDLQRQYQRIRYNVKVGKDLLPNSTVGMRNQEN